MSYKQQTILLILSVALVKMLLGSIVELSNDEAYYWTYARHLQWNYFDHPPMVGILIRLFTANMFFHHEFFVRLPAIVSAAGCSWIIFKLGESLQDAFTGWISVCLYTASFYASIIAGLLILPDSPQLFFWLLSIYILCAVIRRERLGLRVNGHLLLAGVTIGFCILSKIHGVYLWAGFFGYALFNNRSLLKNPFFYLAGVITLAMLVPSFLWSINNHFSTYSYHSARVTVGALHPESFVREIVGEALYQNPVNYVLIIVALVRYKRIHKNAVLLKWLALPLILTVLAISLFNDTLPHWSGPAYVTLLPFTALYLRNMGYQEILPPIIKYALVLVTTALLICVSVTNFYPGSLGEKQLPEFGKHDVTLDMSGWRQLKDSLQQHRADAIEPACIFTNYWFPGGHLAYYVSDPLQLPVKVTGPLNDIHHFAWLNAELRDLPKGRNAWYITISNFYKAPPEELTAYFDSCYKAYTIPQYRSGKVARYFYVYALINYTGGMPSNGILR